MATETIETDATEAVEVDAQQQVAALEQELADFKRKVAVISSAHRRRNDWCGTFNTALREIGLEEVQPDLYSVTITVAQTFTIRAETEDIAKQRMTEVVSGYPIVIHGQRNGESINYGMHEGRTDRTLRVVSTEAVKVDEG